MYQFVPMTAGKSLSYLIFKRVKILLPALLILAIFSCNTDQNAKTFRVGFSQCTGFDSWRQTMLAEMKRELSFHDNIELVYKEAEGNSQKQVAQIEELLREKIDLLIVSPNEVNPLTPIIERVYDSGIPVVVVDRRTGSNKYTAFIGASNYEVGQNAGRYAASILKGNGSIIEVTGIPDASPVIDRHKGFIDIVQQYPGLKYKKRFDNYSTDAISDKNPVYEYLATTKTDLIYAQNDYMAYDVYRICDTLGIKNRIKIIGIDGLPLENAGLDMVANKAISATILYPTGGGEAILTAVNILEKKPFKKENQLFTTVIDSTNVRIMKLQNEKVLAQQADIDKRQRKIEEQILITKNQTNLILIISTTLALALIFGGILFYYLQENKKINKKLEQQKNEISNQRNQLIELVQKVKEATDAKFNFFTNISHEFKTPLTLILGPIESALASAKLHFSLKPDLELVQRNAMRLLRLINQLMDFRKIEEDKMKVNATENNLYDFVVEITNAFAVLAKKKSIALNVIAKTRNLDVWFDTGMLDKVLFNLLSNAFKFTMPGGTVEVLIEKSGDEKNAIIRVKDTGIGMSSEDAEHAFDVFYQGHSQTFKGTGLGLSLSKQLITLHHGTINVTSEKNKGTIFEISLPLGKSHFLPDEIIEEKPATKTDYEDAKIYTADIEPLEKQEQADGNKKEYSILLIEDDDDLRHFLKSKLGNIYEIHEADTGEKGIAAAFEIVPDLIISDIMLPEPNGLAITETLKQDIRSSHIPIILLTAKGSMEEQIKGIKSQAETFIVKPFNLEFLEETIKNRLKNQEMLREHYTSELPTESRSNPASKIDRRFINDFTAIVEENIPNEEFSVDHICKKLGISRVQLYKKVKALIGYNVNDYILTTRLQKAKFLLTNENLTISEVAFRVGFSSQAYFSTVFKSKFGVTPSEFKERKG